MWSLRECVAECVLHRLLKRHTPFVSLEAFQETHTISRNTHRFKRHTPFQETHTVSRDAHHFKRHTLFQGTPFQETHTISINTHRFKRHAPLVSLEAFYTGGWQEQRWAFSLHILYVVKCFVRGKTFYTGQFGHGSDGSSLYILSMW